MAFPSTIVSTAGVGPSSNNTLGPFAISAALYVVIYDSNTPAIAMYKSTDQGITWARVDSAGEVTDIVNANNLMTCCTDGSSIFVVYPNGSTDNVSVVEFDTVTQKWGAEIATDNPWSNSSELQEQPMACFYRVADDSIIILSAPFFTVVGFDSYARCGYFLFDVAAATWGSYIACGLDSPSDPSFWDADCIVAGSAGSVHFIFSVASGIVGKNTYYQQQLSGLNALGVVAEIDSSTWYFGPNTGGPACSDGSEVVVAVLEVFGTPTITVWSGLSSNPISFTSKTRTFSVTNVDSYKVLRVGGITYLFVLADDGAGNFSVYLSTDSGAGFGVPSIIGTSIINFLDIWIAAVTKTVWGLVLSASGYYYAPSPVVLPKAIQGGVGTVVLPSSVGSLCKFGRVKRCVSDPARTILTSGPLVFGGGR